MTFWAQFWPNLVATFFGVFIGFLLALASDRARARRTREAQEAALLRAARDAVQANLTLFTQIKPILTAALQPPSFRMDVGILDAVVPRLAELSPETSLLGKLNNFRFQLDHINRKLDYLLSAVLAPTPANVPAAIAQMQFTTMLANLGGSVLLTVQPLEQSAQRDLVPMIDARVEKLEPQWRLPWWAFQGG